MKPRFLLLLAPALLLGFTGVSRADNDDDTNYIAPSIGIIQVTPTQKHHKKKPLNIQVSAPKLDIGNSRVSGLNSFPTRRTHREPATAPPTVSKSETPPVPRDEPEPTKPKPEKPARGRGPAPVPVHIVPPRYPTSTKSRPSGYVVVDFTVTSSGHTTRATVFKSSPPEVFDDAALDAVRQWSFKPYRIDGKPADVRVRQRIRFSP
jgi:protein TonB